jgi:hypothetical protein
LEGSFLRGADGATESNQGAARKPSIFLAAQGAGLQMLQIGLQGLQVGCSNGSTGRSA